MLTTCGLQQGVLSLWTLNLQAETHLVKSEYSQSRALQVTIASSCQPSAHNAILANLNIALIDTATDADSKLIHEIIHSCRFHSKALYGLKAREISLLANRADAELCLRDGAVETANAMFEKCFASTQHDTAMALLFAERLGDHSTGMNGISATLRWGGVLLSLALKCKNKRQTMQSLRCLGQIFSAQGDDETALSLFKVALDGFTFMDVHRWRVDCMVRMADIQNNCGEFIKAIELWEAARPLFKRSSQMKDVIAINARLAAVDSAVLAECEEQLQRLPEFNVPVEGTYIMENEEEGKLVQRSDFRDRGRQGVLI
ncbi:hypothetical protein C8J57DRAFT_1243573 [Mycena rebaudengoi]|nr:hypothetical protein C8J57DRAFT_1243573 [Mycena rebaudengoi]